MRKSNVLWKTFQSILGFALIGVQSKFLTREDLAVLALAQSLIVIVSLFDFGLGVKITNQIVDRINSENSTEQRFVGFSVLLSNKRQIVLASLSQSVIFLVIFYILRNGIYKQTDLIILFVFFFTILLNSIGNFFGRLFISIGEINFLVKLQGIGALIGFGFGVMGSFSALNLPLAIFSLCLSSVFIALIAVIVSSNNEKDPFIKKSKESDTALIEKPGKFAVVQFSQTLQVFQPVLIQYLILNFFGVSVMITFLVCQRLFNSISSIFGTDLQLNLSLRNQNNLITVEDIVRFKAHLFGFMMASFLASAFCVLFWDAIFSKNSRPSGLVLVSFAAVGVVALIDQLLKYRLYGLKDFSREALGNVFFSVALISITSIAKIDNLFAFNAILFLVYILKFLFLFKSSKLF